MGRKATASRKQLFFLFGNCPSSDSLQWVEKSWCCGRGPNSDEGKVDDVLWLSIIDRVMGGKRRTIRRDQFASVSMGEAHWATAMCGLMILGRESIGTPRSADIIASSCLRRLASEIKMRIP